MTTERDQLLAEIERLQKASGVPAGSPWSDEGSAWTYAEWMEVRRRVIEERDQLRAEVEGLRKRLQNQAEILSKNECEIERLKEQVGRLSERDGV